MSEAGAGYSVTLWLGKAREVGDEYPTMRRLAIEERQKAVRVKIPQSHEQDTVWTTKLQ
jgi:hypothetical protein